MSGPNRVDLARLAAVTGERDVRRATAREADELTGFTIGGIPPFGHVRAARVIMDPDLGRYQVVWAAAGLPTAVFPVPPGDAPDARQRDGRADRRGSPQPADDGSEPQARDGSAPGGHLDDGQPTPQNAGV